MLEVLGYEQNNILLSLKQMRNEKQYEEIY